MQLLDICMHDEGLKRTIEFSKAPAALKSTLRKVVSGLACYTRLDLAMSWIFEKLLTTTEYTKDCEWKKWLLLLLKQVKNWRVQFFGIIDVCLAFDRVYV